MPLQGQLREAHHRYYGNTVVEQYNAGAGGTRYVHREEAAYYFLQSDRTGPLLTARLPYDVRNYPVGEFVTIVNDGQHGGGQSIDIKDGAGTTLLTLVAGRAARCILTDNSTAVGTWLLPVTTGCFNGRNKLS